MQTPFPDHTQIANLPLIEDLYEKYLENPDGIEPSWRYFFQGIDFAGYLSKLTQPEGKGSEKHLRIFKLIQAYRRFGHLAAFVNPLTQPAAPQELSLGSLGFSESELSEMFPTLGWCGKAEAPLQEILNALQAVYASKMGVEYMDLGRPELEHWLAERLEKAGLFVLSPEEKVRLWESLSKTDWLEQFLHRKYVGQTRFSLEGGETMIPLISEIIAEAGKLGVEELLIGMAHRGRLNVLAQILQKPYEELLQEFEDDTILAQVGHDDVKYHMGFSQSVSLPSGKRMTVSMAANPSHLESVDPVVLGQVRALQVLKSDEKRKNIGALLIHGDASIAGQGVIYETLQLMNLPSYSIGGTLHLVVNNQIGYTTGSAEGRSTRYCTDIAKAFGCPVFHVNAEDPENCLLAARLAVELRQTFQCDVFIDLLCYRKYGHNEGDEPSYTQPVEYKTIRAKQSIRDLYTAQLMAEGVLTEAAAEAFETRYKELLAKSLESVKNLPRPSSSIGSSHVLEPFASGVDQKTLQQVASVYCRPPKKFHVHPKLEKWLQDRLQAVMGEATRPSIDWATAECLAFGSLLLQNVSIRLAGEDSQRGTFSQRHLILIDAETGKPYSPLMQLHAHQGRLDVVNTPLTEFAGMAFEYGYSWSAPETLVLWEAQYGDFNNGAQIVIDQYLASGEHKWNTPSSLTLLLPHAYEGAGPEHSSARLERFLQLTAENNMQIVNASTPAQYFHLLRRQALRKEKKPLVVFTPKSLLRSPLNVSPLSDLIQGRFQEILDDPLSPASCQKILFCSGKIYYELKAEREKRNIQDVALIRIEQLYPFHHKKFQEIISNYQNALQWSWVQEESENAGAWSFIKPHLQEHKPRDAGLFYVGRPANATTATGSHRKHKQEQQDLLDRALRS